MTNSISDNYVYESPDGGETITRRLIGQNPTRKEILGDSGKWYAFEELRMLMAVLEEEAQLRQEYPAVKAAWDNYLLVLNLTRTHQGKQDE